MVDLLNIKDPSFIKNMTIKELNELAWQIREFLIENISKTGGHLSSNLGVVEITIALYYVFDPEKDKFLFDVGHQSYVHKILTGRAKDFVNLRQFGGISGYICKEESKYDIWESGHSSTTISAMSGLLIAQDNPDEKIISIIGDTSIMNGVALEGLNFLGSSKKYAPIIILNDNKMGISKSVGALSKTLSRLRGTRFWRGFKRVLVTIFPTFISNKFHQLKRGLKAAIQHDNIFEDMGFDYYGPIKGNDIKTCIRYLQRIKNNTEPVILHIITKKGKGYIHSETDEEGGFHGVEPFDISTGKPLVSKGANDHSFSDILACYLTKKRLNEKFYVITPAMKNGSNLQQFAKLYPNEFFDVGIAEEHAADMSAGIALQGKKVVLLYYSTFSQRAYDEILNDIARQNLPVVIGIDRAGVVGEDGVTHQGIYDIAMFRSMPNMVITMPKDAQELVGLFNYAFKRKGPTVIRYPRKTISVNLDDIKYDKIIEPSWEYLQPGIKTCVISYGPDLTRIQGIVKKNIPSVCIVNARFIKPMDEAFLTELFQTFEKLVVIEQVVDRGGLYDGIIEFKEKNGFDKKVVSIAFNPDVPITHGKIDVVLNNYGMSETDIINSIKE